MLSSPLELQLSRVSEEQLVASGNSAHTNVHAQLTIECQQRRISKMEYQIRGLEVDIVMWRTRFTSAQ